MDDSLSRAERLRRNLVSDVAHELRNPLMNIRGSLELLQDHVLEPTPDTLASLYEETSLLSRLVADLQDLSLAEAGQLRLTRQSVSLEEVTSQAVQMVQPAAARKNLALRMDIPPDLPHVAADPERVAHTLPVRERSRSRPGAMARWSGSACGIPAWALRPSISPTSSSASIVRTPPAHARPVARAWAWRS
jgi:hypothetical protein